MNNYNSKKNFRNFDDRSFGDRRRNFGGRGGMDRSRMVKAICDECGQECELPFKPTGEKPVYCSSCFEKMGGGRNRDDRGGNRRFGGRNDRASRDSRPSRPSQPINDFKKDFEELNNKLNQILEILAANKIKTRISPKSEVAKKEKKAKKTKTAKVKEEVVESLATE